MRTIETTPSAMYAGLQIVFIADENPTREGTKTHALVEFLRKNSGAPADKLFATPFKAGTEKLYLQASDLVWAAHHGFIDAVDRRDGERRDGERRAA